MNQPTPPIYVPQPKRGVTSPKETIKIDQLLVESETMALLIISEIIKAFDGVGTGLIYEICHCILQRREIVDYGLNVSRDQRPYVLATNILD